MVFRTEKGRQEILKKYDQFLSSWVKPNQQKFIHTQYGQTFVICSGSKQNQPVVLLHGSGSNSAMWKEDAMMLSENFRVYAIDIIGECGKSSENRPEWNSGYYAEWLSDIYKGLNLINAIVVGCSLGGWISTEFTSRYPEKVSKLILLATAGISQVRFFPLLKVILASLFGKWGFNQINKMVYKDVDIDRDSMEFILLIKQYFIPRTDALPLFDNRQLNKIKTPVLFIGGENDCFYDSGKTAKRLSKNIESIKNIIIQDTGHVLLDIMDYIIDFINVDRDV